MLEIDRAEVIAEVSEAFQRYEEALATNDVKTLVEAFWDDPRTVRYGGTENLYGASEIIAFRTTRASAGPRRTLLRVLITTFGNDVATVSAEFQRQGVEAPGRQTQTWVRTDVGWRVVVAHVSLLAPDPTVRCA